MRSPASYADSTDSDSGGDPSRPATFLAALNDLVLSLFSASEFRGWIRLYTPEIEASLPGGNASYAEIVGDALATLERHGLLNAEFFALLQIARPVRANEIAAVAGRYGRTSEQAPITPLPRTRSTTSPFIRVSASSDVHERILASWLHLSDINVDGATQGAAAGSRVRILGHLADDAVALVRERVALRPGVVFVTGNSRSSQERGANARLQEREEQWLQELLTSLDVSRDQTFFVPGVRDVDGAAERHIRRLVYAIRTQGEQLDDVLREPGDVELLLARVKRFLGFTKAYGVERATFRGGLWWCHRVELTHRLTLRICGLNTTLLATGEDDRGRLRIGESQLADLLTPAPADHEIVLVLSHHPPSAEWLADHAAVRERLAHDATIYLHGANHAPTTGLQRDADATAPQIAAGAIHSGAESSSSEYGYNYGAIIILRSGRVVLRVWSRTWSREHAHFIGGDPIDVPLPERLRIARPPPATGLQPDDTLKGRYRLVESIGQGGHGKVWRAIDTRSNGELVAVKVLNNAGALAEPRKRKAFSDGARKMKSLQHPAIIRVRAHHQCTGKAEDPYDFYVMDLVDGPDLDRAFKGRPCSDEQTIDMLIEIAEGIGAAHDRDVVHRDLKPSNILRDSRGTLIIVDFDGFKDLSELTSTLSVRNLVSPQYCSPEQLASADLASKRPEAIVEQADKRTDVFSLGVIGIFMHLGDNPGSIYMNRMQECTKCLTCAPGLRDVLARACAFAATDRYSSIHDMIAALRKLRAQLAAPTPDPPPPTVETIPAPPPAPETPPENAPIAASEPVVAPDIELLELPQLEPPPAPPPLPRSRRYRRVDPPAPTAAATTPKQSATQISEPPPRARWSARQQATWIGATVLLAVVLLYAISHDTGLENTLATSGPDKKDDKTDVRKGDTKDVIKDDTKDVIKDDTKDVTKDVTKDDTKDDTKDVTKGDTKDVTKGDTKDYRKVPNKPAEATMNKLRASWLDRAIKVKSESTANWVSVQLKGPTSGSYPLQFK